MLAVGLYTRRMVFKSLTDILKIHNEGIAKDLNGKIWSNISINGTKRNVPRW